MADLTMAESAGVTIKDPRTFPQKRSGEIIGPFVRNAVSFL